MKAELVDKYCTVCPHLNIKREDQCCNLCFMEWVEGKNACPTFHIENIDFAVPKGCPYVLEITLES